MGLLEIIGVVVVALLLAGLYADVLAWPIGTLFLWIQKRLGFPRNVKTGAEGLIGQTATVICPFAWDAHRECVLGKVRLNGEMWWARITEDQRNRIQRGECVRVEGIDGLVLVVCATEAEPQAGGDAVQRNVRRLP